MCGPDADSEPSPSEDGDNTFVPTTRRTDPSACCVLANYGKHAMNKTSFFCRGVVSGMTLMMMYCFSPARYQVVECCVSVGAKAVAGTLVWCSAD